MKTVDADRFAAARSLKVRGAELRERAVALLSQIGGGGSAQVLLETAEGRAALDAYVEAGLVLSNAVQAFAGPPAQAVAIADAAQAYVAAHGRMEGALRDEVERRLTTPPADLDPDIA